MDEGNGGRIGIITMYYKSQNYGGLLQAYALQKALEKMGYDAEQICYKRNSIYSSSGRIKRGIRYCLEHLRNIDVYIKYGIDRELISRRKRMNRFADEEIRHSQKIYSETNLSLTNSIYDAFITGSDQVWANNIPAYFLDFVDNSKKKISYAASIAKTELSDSELQHFAKSLQTYDSISVREENAVGLLTPLASGKKIELVLDPVFLLDKDDWNAISSVPYCNEKYVFCYFLGSDLQARKLADDYAKENNCKIIVIPHLSGVVERADIGFGDEQLYAADPKDFVSLIRYADAVFTDSFHAAAFSCIYNKKLAIFDRVKAENMKERIITLLNIFGMPDRFCDTVDRRTIEYIAQMIDMQGNSSKFVEMKKHSFEYLQTTLASLGIERKKNNA